MTNFEKIKNMNEDELIEFLNSLIDKPIEEIKPYKWFDEKYCKVCPDIEVVYEGKKEIWKECYFEGECSHQDWGVGLIKLWLGAE